MAVFVRLGSWRTRRKARKDEQLIALGAVSAKDNADAERAAQDNLDARLGQFQSHAGDEGKKHY